MTDVEKLLKLKKKIEAQKEEQNKLEGRKSMLMEQLQNEFGCADVQQAKRRKRVLEKELSAAQDSLQKDIDKFEEVYPV